VKRKPNNPRTISKTEYARLQADLEEYGDLGGIVHNETTGNLVGGNQRASVFDLLGKGAEIVIAEEHTEPTRTGETARGYVIWHGEKYDYRRVAWDTVKEDAACLVANLRGGSWDWDMLVGFDDNLLRSMGFDADLLKTLNDDAANLALMLRAAEDAPPEDPGAQVDRAEELQEKWQVRSGQLWGMGEHLLFCGDAKDAQIRSDFAIFDPPWNWTTDAQNAMMDWVKWKNSLVMGVSECMPLSERDDYCSFMIWDQRTGYGISTATKYFTFRSLIVLLWFGERERFYKQDALRVLQKHCLVSDTFKEDIPQLVIIPRPILGHSLHTSEKPAELCEYIVTLFSQKGDTIGDPFAGGGAFLMAAHSLDRKYHGAEIEPKYCAVILDRWQTTTGIAPQILKKA